MTKFRGCEFCIHVRTDKDSYRCKFWPKGWSEKKGAIGWAGGNGIDCDYVKYRPKIIQFFWKKLYG